MATRTCGWIAALLLLQACSSVPRVENSFGGAVRANLSAQTIDPRGAANTNAAMGIDGPAALAAQERYQRSFSQPDTKAATSLLNTLGNGQ